jgi:hypothetical protein
MPEQDPYTPGINFVQAASMANDILKYLYQRCPTFIFLMTVKCGGLLCFKIFLDLVVLDQY